MSRDPNNIITPQYSNSNIISIKNIPDFDIEDWDLNNPKEFAKYLKRIEKICRGSIEYKQYVNFLRENASMNKCSIFKYISNEEDFKIKIHIHHEPITLFDIAKTVFNKRSGLRESLHEELVAEEIMYNHYKMNIGLIPLSETVHELVHNQYIFIPSNFVFGNWKQFVKDYANFIDPELDANLKKIENLSNNYSFDDTKRLLKNEMVYVNVEDKENPTKEELFDLIKQKLNALKANNGA